MRFLPLFLFILFSAFGQEMPPVTNYDATQYSGGNQNWMLSQGRDKHIFVANNSGLLEFDGQHWNLYTVPNGGAVRSILASGDKIYTGSVMDLGFWERNAVGKLEYHSLKDDIKKGILDGEQFWHISELEDYVVFQSHQRLYSYNKKSGEIVPIITEKNISNLFRIGGKIYYQEAEKGLFVIENGKGELLIPNSKIQNKPIIGLFPFGEGEILAVTRYDGLYTISGNDWKPYEVKNYPGSESFFTSLYLQDGTLALGSIGSGLYILNLETSTYYHLSQPTILNNTVLSLMVDDAGNIWAGLDNGLTIINKESPFRLCNDIFGDIGTVYCSYRLGDILYLGTNQGLYYKDANRNEPFNLIEGTSGQVWDINNVNGKLYVGHDRGTFLLKGKSATQIWDGLGTWVVKGMGNGIIQGHYNGLSYLPEDIDNSFSKYLTNFELSARKIVVQNDSVLWVGHDYKGVFRLKLNQDYCKVKEIKNYKVSYQEGMGLDVFSFNDSIYYSTEKAIYKYLPDQDTFTVDNQLNKLIQGQQRVSGVSKVLDDHTWWSFGKNSVFYVTRDDFGHKLVGRSIPLPLEYRGMAKGFENISLIGDHKYLIGSNLGYTVFELPLKKNQPEKLSINRVETSIQGDDAVLQNVEAEEVKLQNEMNYIDFDFGIPYYGKLSNTYFSYRLSDYSNGWTKWTPEASASFKNLPAGDYTFEVRGKLNDQLTNTASYKFSIASPWYFSSLAIAGYVILFLFILILIHYAYKRYHNKVMKEKEKNLRMKNLEAEQHIVKLQNEHLERDMAEKNRELAASTMSLIKKNEFLTSIKESLESGENPKVRSVIRTIDKEISEEDNWKFFKKAFSNADKDFFKKMKAQHPELTSNDLKLCAYLRLNLSSKEIAPLLNISVKSVEIKRYRLRKKMNLDRDTNLTDYILEI